MKLFSKISVCFLLVVNSVYTQTFTPSNDGVFTTLAASKSDIGDYDNDGDLDIITMGSGWGDPNPYTLVYNNDGSGNFTQSSISLGENYRNGQVEFIDYDNDNDLDVFISGMNSTFNSSTNLYENISNTFFEVTYSFVDSGIINNQFAWGDLDMDGDLDLILQGNEDGLVDYTYLYRNDGNNQFSLISQSIMGYSQGKILIGDIDNDGDNDIVCGGIRSFNMWDTTSDSKFYRNNGDFTFTEVLTLEGTMNGDAELRDCNNDGLLDYLLNGQNGFGGTSNNAKIYLNDGSFSFTEYIDAFFPNAGSQSNFVSADYTGNGELDFLIANNGIYIYSNEGDMSLTQNTSTGINEFYLNDIDAGDFDNDGDTDVFLIKNNSSKIYSNQSTTQNTSPTSPSNLISNVIDSEVTLNWDFASDNESPSGQLTYNLYVGTSSGSTDVVTPMADLITGYRKVVHVGNMQYKNEAILKNLPSGTYFWSVQSLDNQYAGSVFAPEQTFVIDNLTIEEQTLNDIIHVFPNPVQDKLNINSKIKVNTIVLCDVTSKVILEFIANSASFELDVSNLQKGVYFLKINTDKGEDVFKVIKK
ncbi:T9SS type A sorting domain-containing protein [Psychroserpens mesophilus]|uniref:T9SS type A sorting domain-containing protein n=1 Tax=Psychroserpens mesophilus TaxID=325473 RepID=UPI0005904B7C|nr:T9SS type A sorting domain-containing protein [Psychroserpens mesophilus]